MSRRSSASARTGPSGCSTRSSSASSIWASAEGAPMSRFEEVVNETIDEGDHRGGRLQGGDARFAHRGARPRPPGRAPRRGRSRALPGHKATPRPACRRRRSTRCSARRWRRRAARGGSWAWRRRATACPCAGAGHGALAGAAAQAGASASRLRASSTRCRSPRTISAALVPCTWAVPSSPRGARGGDSCSRSSRPR